MTIPRLTELETASRTTLDFLRELQACGFEGDVRPDVATRLVTATDNSVYQLMPQAVIYPRTPGDVVAVARLAAEERFRSVTLAPRGGGTGTNGQSLSEGVIVDVSRHMNRILAVDLDAGHVDVEPGVVLDQLNAALEPDGVFFAPNLSPSSRATLGGMIGTDASGKGSRVYGKTSDHVLSLDVVMPDGVRFTAEPLDEAGLEAMKARDDSVGALHRVVDEVVTGKRELIAETFPRLQRFMTGYNLPMVRGGDGRFDLTRLICGAEGTLGVVVGARLRLTPIPTCVELVVLKYGGFDAALADAGELVKADPSAIETIDETVMSLARQDVIWHDVGPLLEPDGDGPRVGTVNLVEYSGTDPAAVRKQVDALVAGAEGRTLGTYVAGDGRERAALWSLRKKGVGLLGNAPGPRKPVPFVEDTVVPPEHLAAYIGEFRAVLEAEGLEYGMFGHVDVGCLHVRPALDLKDPEDERRLRRISDRVVALVQKYGGVIWGEHGKGMRAEYQPRFFGEELFADLGRIKAAADPHGQLNPGKIATPVGGELASIEAPTRGQRDRHIPVHVRSEYAAAIDCNGNGQCFHYSPDELMCPSSKVTRDRVHSPKGRAGVMREWLRQLAARGVDPLAALARPRRWWGAPWRWLARRVRRLGGYDYSHEVHGAMAGCLACKACTTQCPVKVDVPTFRSDFLALYHDRYGRRLRDVLVGGLEDVVPVLGRFPRLANALSFGNPLALWVLRRLGLVDPPKLATRRLAVGLKERGAEAFDLAAIGALPEDEKARAVIVLQDVFTSYFEPEVVLATWDALTALGFRPLVAPYFPNGKGLHVKGFLGRFRRLARRNARTLRALDATGVPVVGLEPAVVLTYRDEYRHALRPEPVGAEVQLLQEWLAKALKGREPLSSGTSGEARTLFGHCTERALALGSMAAWRDVFAAAGLTLRTVSVGCCGMCGAYGQEREHLAESRGLFEMSWKPVIEAAEGEILADGHSCRHQVHRFGGFRPRHPMEALAEALAG